MCVVMTWSSMGVPGLGRCFGRRAITTLCPGGKEVVRRGRVDLTPMLTHSFSLERINDANDLFGSRAEGVLKVAISP